MHCIALIDQTPEAFGVVIPDCPGCCAMGDTSEEAIAQATETLYEGTRDRIPAGFDPPARRRPAELRADPTLADDFAGECLTALIPLAPDVLAAADR